MLDRFGRTVTVTSDEMTVTYTVTSADGAFSVSGSIDSTEAQFLDTINALAPAGWTPPPVVPTVVTMFQCRALLMQMPSIPGPTLFDDVDKRIKALGGVSAVAWEYSTEVSRGGGLITALIAEFGLSDVAVDQMFVAAAGIVV